MVRIASLETFPVGLPFREPYVAATGTLERREMILVRIGDEERRVGWGDAVPLSLRGGSTLGTVRANLDGVCRTTLLGTQIDPAATAEDSLGPLLDRCAAAGAGSPALAAVNAALLDLLGRVRGEPAWRLLGAAEAGPVPCNGTLGGGDPTDVGEAAGRLVDAGFRTLKVKVGTGADRERMRAVRAAAGPDVRLRVDANGAWDVDRARAELRAMSEEVGLELAEQPCPELGDLAALRELVDVPLVADESVASIADAEQAGELGACAAATIKLAKVGGARAALRIAERIPSFLSSALDSPLGIAAALHTAQDLPGEGFVAGLAHGLATTSLFADNVADDRDLLGPTLEPADAPGLGVEIDEAAVERLRIR